MTGEIKVKRQRISQSINKKWNLKNILRIQEMENIRMKKILAVILTITTLGLHAAVINVKDFGAKGDGKNDDTMAIQTAILKASPRGSGGVLYFPSGHYRITQTLIFEKVMGLIVRGEGSLGHYSSHLTPKASNSLLFWDGEAGGTMVKTIGSFGCTWEHLSFSGRRVSYTNRWKWDLPTAGILFHINTIKGFGNMIHNMSNLSFSHADTGIQCGSIDGPPTTDSDMYFQNNAFSMLKTGFKTVHQQNVDYLFDFTFMGGVKTAFDFKKGGNFTSNNFQGTCIDLVLNVENCGANNGTFLFTQTRLECSTGGSNHRHQLLKANSKGPMVNIKFISFTDAQWAWFKNKTKNREIYLCEIGKNTMVSFENSTFQGPIIDIKATKNNNSYAFFRECFIRYITPWEAIKANEYGFYKTFDLIAPNGTFQNIEKWPKKLISKK